MESTSSHSALVEEARALGVEYERRYGGCGQCTIAAVLDTLRIERPDVFKAATAFAGGVGLAGDGCCGAYLGAVMTIAGQFGRERSDFLDPGRNRHRSYALAREIHAHFIDTYGSVICRDIQQKIFGRSFNLRDRDDYRAFEAAGGHVDKCPEVVGSAVGWVVEIMEREGVQKGGA